MLESIMSQSIVPNAIAVPCAWELDQASVSREVELHAYLNSLPAEQNSASEEIEFDST